MVNIGAKPDPRLKMKEDENQHKYLAWELKKAVEHEGGGDTSGNGCA